MRRSILITILPALLSIAGCSSDNGQHGFDYAHTNDTHQAQLPAVMPAMIYVEDFDLGSTELQRDPGLLANRPRLIDRFTGKSQDPADQLRAEADLLAGHIVDELHDQHLPAQRLAPGEVPVAGWKVSGAFLQVDQGNRLQRAALGFGMGASDAKLYVAVTDLSQTTGQAFVDFNMDSSTGNGPGGLVTLNPYAVAIKYVLTRDASDQDIKRAALEIARDIKNLTPAGK